MTWEQPERRDMGESAAGRQHLHLLEGDAGSRSTGPARASRAVRAEWTGGRTGGEGGSDSSGGWKQAYDADRNTFRRPTEATSAGCLRAADSSRFGLLPADDPRWVGTVDAVAAGCGERGRRRYSDRATPMRVMNEHARGRPDCSFCWADSLAIDPGGSRSRDLYEKLVACANDLSDCWRRSTIVARGGCSGNFRSVLAPRLVNTGLHLTTAEVSCEGRRT